MRVAALVLATILGITGRLPAQAPPASKVVPVQVTGDAASRFSLVVLGDGYTASEQPRFRQHLDKHLNILWSLEPFRSYRNYINVYAVEIDSPESGVTCDPAHRQRRNTPLQMQFGGGCENPNARGITPAAGAQEAARSFARLATPNYDQVLVITNTDTYGGIGGSIATTSGGNSLGPYITPHELGHSLGRLQDEYTYSARGVAGPAYSRGEPTSIHHTLLTEEQMRSQQQKWWRWLGEPSESGGLIGRFEGGQSSVSGIWRPSKHSMMISLGYYFDQVSLERMAQRISGQVNLIASATPAGRPVAPNQVIWIETAHPNYHELNITWDVDGRVIPEAANQPHLPLTSLRLDPGQHKVTVKVVDPTPFVRDPVIRDTSFSATRSWTIDPAASLPASSEPLAFLSSSQTARPLAGTEVVYVETAHPADRVLGVVWQLNNRVIREAANRRTFNLAKQNLRAGTHRLSATVTDPANPRADGQTLNWTIDNTGPTVGITMSQPSISLKRQDGTPVYVMRDEFTMKLEPKDDQTGYVVGEFRVNGDGWHHYYGWPDAEPGAPFRFTPRGTTIKELVYGSLSSEGLSPQPWEAREPGWGVHRVEYRARDAAGNIGAVQQFVVTFLPTPACTSTINGQHQGDLVVQGGVTCANAATINGNVTVSQGATFSANNATIRGGVTASNAAVVELLGSTISGPVRIDGTTGHAAVVGNRISQTLSCTGNLANKLFVSDNTSRTASGQCGATR